MKRFLSLAFIASALMACVEADNADNQLAANPTVVKIAGYTSTEPNGDSYNALYQDGFGDLIDHINNAKLIDGIRIEWTQYDPNDRQYQLRLARESGQYDIHEVTAYSLANGEVALSDFASIELENIDLLPPGLMNNVKVADGYIGVPRNVYLQGLFYNSKLMAENGWQLPNDYQSMLALFQQAENAGIVPFDFAGGEQWFMNQVVFDAVLSGLVSEQTLAGLFNEELCFTDANVVDAFEQFAQLKPYMPIDIQGRGYQVPRASWARGESLFTLNGSWVTAKVGAEQISNQDIEFAFAPLMGTGNAIAVHADAYYVADKNTNKLDAVTKVLNFFSSPEYAQLQIEYKEDLPAVRGDYDTSKAKAPHIEAQLAALEQASNYYFYGAPQFNGKNEGVRHRAGLGLQLLLSEQWTAEQFTQYLQASVNQINSNLAAKCAVAEFEVPAVASESNDITLDLTQIQWQKMDTLDFSGWDDSRSEDPLQLLYQYDLANLNVQHIYDHPLFGLLRQYETRWWWFGADESPFYAEPSIENGSLEMLPNGLRTLDYEAIVSSFTVNLPLTLSTQNRYQVDIQVEVNGVDQCDLSIPFFNNHCINGATNGRMTFTNSNFSTSQLVNLRVKPQSANKPNASIKITAIDAYKVSDEYSFWEQFGGLSFLTDDDFEVQAQLLMRADNTAKLYSAELDAGQFQVADLTYRVQEQTLIFSQNGADQFSASHWNIKKIGGLDWAKQDIKTDFGIGFLAGAASVEDDDFYLIEAKYVGQISINGLHYRLTIGADGLLEATSYDSNAYFKFLDLSHEFFTNTGSRARFHGHKKQVTDEHAHIANRAANEAKRIAEISYTGKGYVALTLTSDNGYPFTVTTQDGQGINNTYSQLNDGSLIKEITLYFAADSHQVYVAPISADFDDVIIISANADEPDKLSISTYSD